MKRYFAILVLLAVFAAGCLCAVAQPAAVSRAAEIVGALSAKFRALNAYEVGFTLTSGDYSVSGSYRVEGERYNLRVGDAEVFADGKTRYEVDRARREVTVVEVDTASRNLLNDPVHAFEFADAGYRSLLVWEREGRAAVRLTPASSDAAAAGIITLTLSTADLRPLALEYDYDGERITIAINSFGTPSAPCPAFDRARFADYEFIDFR